MLFIIVKTYKLLSGCTCHVCHRGLPFAVCYTLFLIYVNSVKVNFGHLACIVHAVSLVSTICGWKTWIPCQFDGNSTCEFQKPSVKIIMDEKQFVYYIYKANFM